MSDEITVTIEGHTLSLKKVIEALDGESIGEVLGEMEAAELARNLPTMVLAEELECRPDIARDFLCRIAWMVRVEGIDTEAAVAALAAENGVEWPVASLLA